MPLKIDPFSIQLGFYLFRLNDITYTDDEIREIIDHMEVAVSNEIEAELLNTAHATSILLQQLFSQAEKWHLKLNTNISELENK